MLRVFANNKNYPAAADDLAFLAHWFYGSPYFHNLSQPPYYSSAGQIVRSNFNNNFITGKDPDLIDAQFACNMSQNDLSGLDLHTKNSIG